MLVTITIINIADIKSKQLTKIPIDVNIEKIVKSVIMLSIIKFVEIT